MGRDLRTNSTMSVNMDTLSAIMEPIEFTSSSSPVEICDLKDAMESELKHDEPCSISMNADVDVHEGTKKHQSFLLLDDQERLSVPSAEAFAKHLKCLPNTNIKVVSIFGNTGDGKSHTMNHTFFAGENVFKTSPEQTSCTLGVWAALQAEMGVLCLDTEGMLGIKLEEHQRTRMLLKVLAISDIVIYRTRSERLHNDMYKFLGNASLAFTRHFSEALQALNLPGPPQSLGPAVIIFHETCNTIPLRAKLDSCPEDELRKTFKELNMTHDAFSSLKYVGVQTIKPPTAYNALRAAVISEVDNTKVRSSRHPSVVFQALHALNAKFSGTINEQPINPFPEQYFACTAQCASCEMRCERSMGHGSDHKTSKRCRYQHQYGNKVFLCQVCLRNGREVIVNVTTQSQSESSWLGLAKFAWSGSVIECLNCGEIYRSRQYWYGNKSPEDYAVKSEIVHVWRGSDRSVKSQMYSAQMLLDGVSYLAETVSNLSAQPSKAITDWATDKIAPDYWVPNSQIINCHSCSENFEMSKLPKHHCRRCGRGFCSSCSNNEMPVPERGWTEPVRVCNSCRDELLKAEVAGKTSVTIVDFGILTSCMVSLGNNFLSTDVETNHRESSPIVGGGFCGPVDDSNIRARRVGEAVISTLTSVASVLEYPKDFIKDSVRPAYWESDAVAKNCAICDMPFGSMEKLSSPSGANGSRSGGSSPRASGSPGRGAAALDRDRRRHHCRNCGRGVCNNCSRGRRPVPNHGWTTDVRVCDKCINLPD
ncbi:zinc finger FYVE domain-containing protein 1-like isoform X1 [Phlebotomus papatasi]|uniref:zinc finger FYVE domain-containing protein 1-like isoform X1 n=1 Tax=Phlebotomus papatasi TaxID=29031 RepID=UPI002483A98D|nr:zinc finger FYVE domain-containing protein 1-like isoform X1 [Phlebotomus papatasi]